MSLTYKREPLEENEIEALRKACKTFEEGLVVNVLLDTGMRVSELAYLKEENIAWQRNCITIINILILIVLLQHLISDTSHLQP